MYTTSSIESDLLNLDSYPSSDLSPDEPPSWLTFGHYEFGKLEPKMQVKLIQSSDWQSIQIPSAEELEKTPIYLSWHKDGLHEIKK